MVLGQREIEAYVIRNRPKRIEEARQIRQTTGKTKHNCHRSVRTLACSSRGATPPPRACGVHWNANRTQMLRCRSREKSQLPSGPPWSREPLVPLMRARPGRPTWQLFFFTAPSGVSAGLHRRHHVSESRRPDSRAHGVELNGTE